MLSLVLLCMGFTGSSGCADGEYSFQGSQCLQCSSYIPYCSACSSGSYTGIANPSFEELSVSNYYFTTYLDGWVLEAGKLVEINTDGVYPSQDERQYISLVSSDNYYIYQDVPTEIGYFYQVDFYLSPFPGYGTSTNTVLLSWGDTSRTIDFSGIYLASTNWMQYHSEIIQATSSTTRLKFEGASTGSSQDGPFLDNISLKNFPSCSGCSKGYYLNNSSCDPCPDYDSNCEVCNPECIDCSSGYYLYEENCLQCNENFQNCPTNGVGLSCVNGFFLENGRCIECPENCSICNSTTTCDDCSSGYYLYEGNCLQCNENFQSCPTNGDGLSCVDGFFLENGLCLECLENCSMCTSATTCDDCSSGYYLYEGNCLQCNENFQNCPTNGVGLSCVDRFFLENGLCLECLDNCSICTSTTTCDDCSSGYYLYQGSCLKCNENFQSCPTNGDGLSCVDGFLLENGLCIECPENCSVCTSATNCIDCLAGYYTFQGSCSQCNEHFQNCSTDGEGLSCKDRYYLELLQGQCVACPENCSRCESLSTCTECDTPFTLENSECVCPEGSFYKDSGCSSCTEIHQECLLCDSEGCSKCSENYYISDRNCSISIAENGEGTQETDSSNEEEANSFEKDESILGLSSGESGIITASLGVGISGLASLLSGNPSVLWLFLNVGNLIYFIPLMGTNMTESMKDFLKGFQLNTFEIIPNFGELIGLKEEDYEETPEKWRSYGIESVSFLLNSGESLSSFIILFCCLPVLYMFYVICCFSKYLMRLISEYKWNFFIRFWIQVYLEFMIFGLLSLRSSSINDIKSEEWLSIALLILGLVSPLLILIFLLRNRGKIRIKETFKTCTLFYEFNRNAGISRMLYYFIFLGRRLFFAIGIFYLEGHKVIQVIVNSGFSLIMIFYMMCYTPYKEKLTLFLNTASELCILVVFLISGMCLIHSSENFYHILNLVLHVSVIALVLLCCLIGICSIILSIRHKRSRRRCRIITIQEQATKLRNKMYRKSHGFELRTIPKPPRDKTMSEVVTTKVSKI